jgi:hypothetical protein
LATSPHTYTIEEEKKTIFTAIVVTSITKGGCIYNNNNIDEVIITGALSDGNNMTSHAYHQQGGYIFTFYLFSFEKITKREEDSRSTLDNERVHLDALKIK